MISEIVNIYDMYPYLAQIFYILFFSVSALNSTCKYNEAYDAYMYQWIELIWSDMVKHKLSSRTEQYHILEW